MKADNLLLIVAIIAVAVSLLGAGLTYNYLTSFRNKLTGFAATTGSINLTVESLAMINFTTATINWGSGRVNTGNDNATLNTAAGANNVTNGNWTGNTAGFIVENIGNQNVTFFLKTGKNATTLLGGASGGGPKYQYNATNKDPGSCLNTTATGVILGTFYNVNTTGTAGTKICDRFLFDTSTDELRIDVRLVIPSDSFVGELTDTFTVTFDQA